MESATEVTMKEGDVFDLQLPSGAHLLDWTYKVNHSHPLYYPFFFNKSGDHTAAFLSGSRAVSSSENPARCIMGTDIALQLWSPGPIPITDPIFVS